MAASAWTALKNVRLLDRRVWLLTVGTVLASTGRGVLLPFATIYFYDEKLFPLALIGLAFAIAMPLGAVVGLFWGTLADRIGRKPLMALGFAGQAVTTAALAFVETPLAYILVILANAVFTSAWNPSSRAMVADVTEPHRRTRAYGLLYMANNLGLSVGLLLGGVLAIFLPFRLLFFIEAAGLAAYLVVLLVGIRESHTRAADAPRATTTARERILRHFAGMATPLRDRSFLLFALATTLAGFGWAQFYITYSPYMRDYLGLSTVWIGVMFAINTVMVVALQVPIAAMVERRSRTASYIFANHLLAWSLILLWASGRTEGLPWILALLGASVVIMTIGEIMVVPLGNALSAGLAGGQDHFGKYMAAFDLTWTLAAGLGSVLGGLFFDLGRPMLLWPTMTGFVILSFGAWWWLGRVLPPDVDDPAAHVAPPPAPAPGSAPK